MSVVSKVKPFLGAALLCVIAIAGVLAWTSGYRLYIVETGSMAPTLMAGDAVFDGPPKDTYQPGAIITFRHSDLTTDLVTHTVINVQAGKIHTKGDANRTADVWNIRPDQVHGVVVRRFPRLGNVLIFMKQPGGIASVVVGGLALTLLWRMLFPSAKKRAQSEAVPTPGPPTPHT